MTHDSTRGHPALIPSPLYYGLCGLLGQAPDADGVSAASETSADMANLGESRILSEDVTNLIHGGTPAEPIVQMVK